MITMVDMTNVSIINVLRLRSIVLLFYNITGLSILLDVHRL